MGGSDPAPPDPPGALPAPTVRKELGVTHAEFFRVLPEALGGVPFRQEGPRIVLEGEGPRLEIVLGSQQERRLGAVRLPVTPVELTFRGHTPSERAALLARFERAFFKGGG